MDLRQSVNTDVDEVPDHEPEISRTTGPKTPPPILSVFLNTVAQQSDIISVVCEDYLDIYDIVSLAITCKTLFRLVFENEKIWTKELHRGRQLKLFGNVPFLPVNLCLCGRRSREVAKLFLDDGEEQEPMHSGELRRGSCMLHVEEAMLSITAFPDYPSAESEYLTASGVVVLIDEIPDSLQYKQTKSLLMVAIGFASSDDASAEKEERLQQNGKMLGECFLRPNVECKRWIVDKIQLYRNQALPQSKRIWHPKMFPGLRRRNSPALRRISRKKK